MLSSPASTNIPMYQEELPQDWFAMLEECFEMRHITSQETKFYILGSHLPIHILKKVTDVVGNMPKENAYDTLKRVILSRTSKSKEAQFQQLLSYLKCGNQKPSMLLQQMQTLTHNLGMNEPTLYHFWFAALPGSIKALLVLQPKDTPLSTLAQLADRVYEYSVPERAAEEEPKTPNHSDIVTQILRRLEALELKAKSLDRSRSKSRGRRRRSNTRSHSQGICYYHRRFGDDARKCAIPCSYKSKNKCRKTP